MDLRAVEEALQLDAREHRLLVEVKLEKIHQQLCRVIGVIIQLLQKRVQSLIDTFELFVLPVLLNDDGRRLRLQRAAAEQVNLVRQATAVD